MWSDLPKVTQLVNGRASIQTQSLTQKLLRKNWRASKPGELSFELEEVGTGNGNRTFQVENAALKSIGSEIKHW